MPAFVKLTKYYKETWDICLITPYNCILPPHEAFKMYKS